MADEFDERAAELWYGDLWTEYNDPEEARKAIRAALRAEHIRALEWALAELDAALDRDSGPNAVESIGQRIAELKAASVGRS